MQTTFNDKIQTTQGAPAPIKAQETDARLTNLFSGLAKIKDNYNKEKCINYLEGDVLIKMLKAFSNSEDVEFDSDILKDLFESMSIEINFDKKYISYEEFKTVIKDNIDSGIHKLISELSTSCDFGYTRANLEDYINSYVGISKQQREVIRNTHIEEIKTLEEYLSILGLRVHPATFNSIIDVEFTDADTGLVGAGTTTILGEEFKVYKIDGQQYIKALELSRYLGYKSQGAMYKLVNKEHKIKRPVKGHRNSFIFITIDGVNSILKRSKKAQEKRLNQANENNINLKSFIPALIDQLKEALKDKEDAPSNAYRNICEMKVIENSTDVLKDYYCNSKYTSEEDYLKITSKMDYKLTAPFLIPEAGIVLQPKGMKTPVDYFLEYDPATDYENLGIVFDLEIIEFEPGREFECLGRLIAKLMQEVYECY